MIAAGRAAAGSITISSPHNGATVSGIVTIVSSESPDVIWVNIFVDKVLVGFNWPAGNNPTLWDSALVPDGSYTISAAGYGFTGAMVAGASIEVTVNNGARPQPTSTPVPTAVPTPAPGSPGSFPLSDAAAAAKVVVDSGFEPRPANGPANHSVPGPGALTHIGSLSFLDSHGNALLHKVTGNYTGTTDEILQWAAYKWGFDPDITRANAVTESHWKQYDIGDVGNGVSLGILQIKSADFPGTCDPVSLAGGDISQVTDSLCLSYLHTAFAADYKLAYQRACMDGSITYLGSQTPAAGYPTYSGATGTDRLWGCVGDWYSGNWYDSGAISYIHNVQDNLANKPWLQPGF